MADSDEKLLLKSTSEQQNIQIRNMLSQCFHTIHHFEENQKVTLQIK